VTARRTGAAEAVETLQANFIEGAVRGRTLPHTLEERTVSNNLTTAKLTALGRKW